MLHIVFLNIGLDPAGPLFTFPNDVGINKRLDPSDAQHVQCLHTNRGVSGSSKAICTSDYFANMGAKQPGCSDSICSHSRATYIFETSFENTCIFMGRQCASDIKSVQNKCAEITDRFGVHGKKTPGRFYFKTDKCYPYCLNCVRK